MTEILVIEDVEFVDVVASLRVEEITRRDYIRSIGDMIMRYYQGRITLED